MFWGIKSKRLDVLFPWRYRDIHDWDVSWWQRPFLCLNGYHCRFNASFDRLFRVKRFFLYKEMKFDILRVLLGMLLVIGWFWSIPLIFRYKRGLV